MQLNINNELLQRLGIADGAEYIPVPFEAFDTVDFGANTTALANSYTLFDASVNKGDQYRNFTWTNNKYATIVTRLQFKHTLALKTITSGTTDYRLLADYFEQFSIVKFGFDEKNIFQPRVANLVPYTRCADNKTLTMVEKENDWYELPYPLEIALNQVGTSILYTAAGCTTHTGGTSDAETPYLYNYPNPLASAGNNSSNMHFYGVFQMSGIRFVRR